jgi:hypothetical protein
VGHEHQWHRWQDSSNLGYRVDMLTMDDVNPIGKVSDIVMHLEASAS